MFLYLCVGLSQEDFFARRSIWLKKLWDIIHFDPWRFEIHPQKFEYKTLNRIHRWTKCEERIAF